MVKRYDLRMYYDEWQDDECDDGDWVKYDDHAAELATIRAENERLREALGFYAEWTNYAATGPISYHESNIRIVKDAGQIAKEVLK